MFKILIVKQVLGTTRMKVKKLATCFISLTHCDYRAGLDKKRRVLLILLSHLPKDEVL